MQRVRALVDGTVDCEGSVARHTANNVFVSNCGQLDYYWLQLYPIEEAIG